MFTIKGKFHSKYHVEQFAVRIFAEQIIYGLQTEHYVIKIRNC